MRHPDGDPGDDVTDELPRAVRPQPVQDGQVDEEELAPLFEGVGGQESVAEGLGEHAIAEVSHLCVWKGDRGHTNVRLQCNLSIVATVGETFIEGCPCQGYIRDSWDQAMVRGGH